MVLSKYLGIYHIVNLSESTPNDDDREENTAGNGSAGRNGSENIPEKEENDDFGPVEVVSGFENCSDSCRLSVKKNCG